MLRAWRIIKTKYADHAFDGEGARLYGGRWTSPGNRAVYTASSLSLATLEMLVHLQTSSTLDAYSVCTVNFTEELVEELNRNDLPENWREYPPPVELQKLGDRWIKEESSVILRVPSVIIPHEHNYLINPLHENFSRLSMTQPEPFDIDPRLFGR